MRLHTKLALVTPPLAPPQSDNHPRDLHWLTNTTRLSVDELLALKTRCGAGGACRDGLK